MTPASSPDPASSDTAAARPGHTPGSDTRRSDARRNHERVVAAAIEVFAERGLEGTIPEIASRAGVGKATVYRSYPTKDDLVTAVALRRLGWLADQVSAAGRRQDAFAALRDLLGDVSAKLATDRLLAEVLPHATRWRQENDLGGQLGRLIARAQDQGRLRPDTTVQDIHVFVSGFSRVLIELDIRDPAVWRRYATLALNALRPDQPDEPPERVSPRQP